MGKICKKMTKWQELKDMRLQNLGDKAFLIKKCN